MPQYAVISCGKDNSYGHPDDNLLSRLRDADVITYRTDMQGDIICTSDGKTVSFTTARNADAQTNPTIQTETTGQPAAELETAPVVRQEEEPAPEPEPPQEQKEAPKEEPAAKVTYIGNANSHKFHKPTCRTLPTEHNRVRFDSRLTTNGGCFPKSCTISGQRKPKENHCRVYRI